MASDNGHGLTNENGHANGGVTLTPGEFDAMTDAGDKPLKTTTRARAAATPKVRASAAAVPETVVDGEPEAVDPAKVQAARERYYTQKQIPAPLRSIFDRLPPNEIDIVVTQIDFAYRSGLTEGTAASGGKVTVACGQDHEKYNEVIATLLSAVELLDSPRPDIAGCLKLADQAHERLVATP